MSENENPQTETNTSPNSYNVELNSLNNYSFSMSESVYTNNMTFDQLKGYIKYPMVYNAILREISRQSYGLNGIYGSTIDKMIALPTLSHITTLRNKTQQMKDKKKKFNLLLKLLNIDRTTRDILRSLFIEGYYVGTLRDTSASNKNVDTSMGLIENIDRLEGLSLDDNFMIQPLDLDYCKIIGFQNNVSIAAFDMMYFDQFKHGGLLNEIKNFPKDFATAYIDYKKDGSKRWHILDYRKTIALKAKASEMDAYGIPFGVSAFADMKMEEDYESNRYQLISELASSIYMLLLPEGEKPGSSSLNKDQQEAQIAAFKNAVRINTNGNVAKISTLTLAPAAKVERLSKDSALIKDSLSDENMKKISSNLGFAVSALNAESDSGNLGSLQINLDLISAQIFQYVNEIAREETRVLNHHLGIKPIDYIDIKFLPITWLNKKDSFEKAGKLYTQGKGSLKFWVASMGVDVDDYISLMDEELEEDFENKYPVHATSATFSGKDDEGGAPPKSDGDLKTSGLITRNLKSNEQKVKSKK
jgi:hypothetical protein